MTEFIDIPMPGWPLEFGEAGRPGVVLVHDRYGRLPYLESLGKALAGAGFRTVVPDLFSGLATVDDEGAAQLETGMDPGFALATLEDAILLARSPLGVNSGAPVAAVGFGLGGYLALRSAQAGLLDAVVSYCAVLGADDPGVIPCPVLVHEAEVSQGARQGSIDDFVGRLRETGTSVTMNHYPGTTETFSNTSLDGRYERVSAALAFSRTGQFLRKHLVE